MVLAVRADGDNEREVWGAGLGWEGVRSDWVGGGGLTEEVTWSADAKGGDVTLQAEQHVQRPRAAE